MPLIVYVIDFILIGVAIGLHISDKSKYDGKQVRMKLEDIPDSELGALADIFAKEIKRRDELRKEERPFDEYEE